AQHAEEHEVVDVLHLPGGAGLLGAYAAQPPRRGERDEVHDSVPVDFEWPPLAGQRDFERDRIEAGVLDHAARILVYSRVTLQKKLFRYRVSGMAGCTG